MASGIAVSKCGRRAICGGENITRGHPMMIAIAVMAVESVTITLLNLCTTLMIMITIPIKLLALYMCPMPQTRQCPLRMSGGRRIGTAAASGSRHRHGHRSRPQRFQRGRRCFGEIRQVRCRSHRQSSSSDALRRERQHRPIACRRVRQVAAVGGRADVAGG